MVAPKSAEVDAYIAAAPPGAQKHLRRLRAIIRAKAPGAEERMSYQMPYYRYHGHLVYFAAFKDHVGLYPAGYTEEHHGLMAYAAGRGTYRFSLDQPLPETQIRKFVRIRAKENEAGAKSKRTGAGAHRSSSAR